MLCLLLDEDERFEVVGRAQDGREAVELAQRMGPDLVVMDIEMPVLDGIEATRVLREGCPEVPIVAISGHDYEARGSEHPRDVGDYEIGRVAIERLRAPSGA